jgi:ComF family protein
MKFGEFLMCAIFPEFCVLCGSEGAIFCLHCKSAFVTDVERREQRISLGPYRDPVLKGLIKEWKFSGVMRAGEELCGLLQRAIVEYREVFPLVDCVTWIPLHKRKFYERGFDQAEMLASVVSAVLQVSCCSLLKRKKYTAQQSSGLEQERQKTNFNGVFECVLAKPPRRVLLVDDVYTTGVTMRAAEAALRAGGVSEVWGFTVARG